MRDEHGGRLDRAIDRAVRDMVQLEPRPGLSGRVAARLERPVSGSSRWIPAVAAAAAALVVLLTAFALHDPAVEDQAPATRITSATPPPATLPRPAPPPEPAIAPAVPVPSPADRAAALLERAAPPRSARSIFGEPTGRVSAADTGSAPDAPSLESAADIELRSVPSTLAPLAPITIAPLRLAPITLSPLTVNARPGGR